MRTILLAIILLALPAAMLAQDTLVLKDGRTLPCKISGTDSANVYFDTYSRNQKIVHTVVSKNNIQEIRYHPAAPDEGKTYRTSSFGILAGISLPTGEFANDDINSEDAGMAGKGININAVFKNYFTRNFGLAVKAFYNNNLWKVDKLGDQISSMLKMPVTNNTVKYISFGFLTGPELLLPVDKLSVNGHLLCGYAHLTEQEVTFAISSGINYGWIKFGKISRGAFMSDFGGGLVYSVNENWNLTANVDYLSGTFDFNKITISYSSGENQKLDRLSQKYGVVSICAGIEIKF